MDFVTSLAGSKDPQRPAAARALLLPDLVKEAKPYVEVGGMKGF